MARFAFSVRPKFQSGSTSISSRQGHFIAATKARHLQSFLSVTRVCCRSVARRGARLRLRSSLEACPMSVMKETWSNKSLEQTRACARLADDSPKEKLEAEWRTKFVGSLTEFQPHRLRYRCTSMKRGPRARSLERMWAGSLRF
jgi:hypothetical protein